MIQAVTFSSPSWRSLSLSKRSRFHLPKKVTSRTARSQECVFSTVFGLVFFSEKARNFFQNSELNQIEWCYKTSSSLTENQQKTGQSLSKISLTHHLSNEKNPGWLGYIGDEILPSYIGDYFINHEIRIPSLTIQYFMESKGPRVFFVAHLCRPSFPPRKIQALLGGPLSRSK